MPQLWAEISNKNQPDPWPELWLKTKTSPEVKIGLVIFIII